MKMGKMDPTVKKNFSFPRVTAGFLVIFIISFPNYSLVYDAFVSPHIQWKQIPRKKPNEIVLGPKCKSSLKANQGK